MRKQEVTNFARFYTLFNKLPYGGDREELKRQTVSQYTWGRTEHLREMTRKEYDACCSGLEKMIPGYENSREHYIQEMKRKRSAVLHQMQLYRIDTSDWNRVDNFCLSPRIAGKKFRDLDGDELDRLLVKIRMIIRKRTNNK